MELPIVLALLTSFVVTISSHPKNSDILPNDYYQRQVLQPIPGYIPVYIKADGEPLVRTQTKKPIATVPSQKTVEVPNEKDLPRHSDETVSVEKKKENSGRTGTGGRTEGVENGKDTPSEVSQKQDEGKATMTEHRSEVDDAKIGSKAQKTPQTVS